MSFSITDSKKTFGPDECWCTQHGQVFYPCKKNKLCKKTNEKFQKMRQKYLKSKTYKKDKERRKTRSLERAKKRREHKKTKAYKRFTARYKSAKK
jgi:hypothetical protein